MAIKKNQDLDRKRFLLCPFSPTLASLLRPKAFTFLHTISSRSAIVACIAITTIAFRANRYGHIFIFVFATFIQTLARWNRLVGWTLTINLSLRSITLRPCDAFSVHTRLTSTRTWTSSLRRATDALLSAASTFHLFETLYFLFGIG